ncbi:hypothetical protein GCM10010465_15350 [Actinomadura fibrosa]
MLMVRNGQDISKNFLYVSNISLTVICLMLFLRILRYKNVYEEQMDEAVKFRVEYPVGSTVFLSGPIRYLYILNNYKNPVLKQVGYDYSFHPDDDFRKKYEVISSN